MNKCPVPVPATPVNAVIPINTVIPINVLLVENSVKDARLIRQALAGSGSNFRLTWVRRIATALRHLTHHSSASSPTKASFDVILLDLFLPDGQGMAAFTSLFEAAPSALFLVLSSPDDEAIAREAVNQGAYDYLGKSHVNAHWLPRVLRYVTERKGVEAVLRASEEALYLEKERAQVTLNSIGDAVLVTDVAGKVTYLNLVAEGMTGWCNTEAINHALPEVFNIINSTTRDKAENPAQQAIRENRVVGLAANSVLIRRDGSEFAIEDSSAPIHDRQGKVSGAVIVFRDVSASRAVAQRMAHLAQHDDLTGLTNRLFLKERLAQTLAQAERHQRLVALLFLDLDYFKYINDSLGHAVGDQLLISVSQRLKTCVRSSDTVCRQGGDEFVIMLAEIDEPGDAAQVAAKILSSLTVPHHIQGHELHISISIGISIFPDDGISVSSLMKNADTAMYHAKTSGRSNYQFFRPEMNKKAMLRMSVESKLRRAITRQEFVLHYQPQIDLTSGEMTGAEALIRWQDPELGLIYPDQFVPVAEESGLIVAIGRWVLRAACMQVRAWLDAGLDAVPVAVNISAIELHHLKFLDGVKRILAETGLPTRYIKLELTESVLIQDSEALYLTLEELRIMGIRLAIDDFGTGYSSLSYLKRFPIDTLKIDRSFVHDMATDDDDAAIVSAVIAMARKLNQRVVAEGVETEEQLTILRAQHCETGQGFQFSHPLSADHFAALLTHGDQHPLRATGTLVV